MRLLFLVAIIAAVVLAENTPLRRNRDREAHIGKRSTGTPESQELRTARDFVSTLYIECLEDNWFNVSHRRGYHATNCPAAPDHIRLYLFKSLSRLEEKAGVLTFSCLFSWVVYRLTHK